MCKLQSVLLQTLTQTEKLRDTSSPETFPKVKLGFTGHS